MTLSYLLAALRRRPWLPIASAVLFLLVATQVVSARTPYYEASTLILVQPPASVAGYDAQQYVAGQAALIEGSSLASTVASDFDDLTPLSVQKATTVTQVDNGQTIEIAVLLPDATQAADVANTYAEAYLAEQGSRIDGYYDSQLTVLNDDANALLLQITEKQETLAAATGDTAADLARQNRINAELGTLQSEYNNIQTTIRQLELDRGSVGATEIVQPAREPESPSGVPNLVIIVVIEILGLIVGAVLAVFAALMSGKVVDDNHTAEVAHGTVVGSFPKVKAWRDGPGSALTTRSTNVDRLTDELLVRSAALSSESDGASRIVVVSSRRGIGTTSLAVALAARSEARRYDTLLVDADRRNPYLGHELIDATPRFNLSTFVDAIDQSSFDTEPWRRLTGTAPSSDIAVLPMDAFRPELTTSAQFEQLDQAFDRLTVDTIVIDAGAVLDSVTVGRLCRNADAVVLLVPRHREEIKTLEACAATLRVDEDRLLVVTTPLSGTAGEGSELVTIPEMPNRIESNKQRPVPNPPQTSAARSPLGR